jgi:NADH:ubiquinone oxidoreductase subunit K
MFLQLTTNILIFFSLATYCFGFGLFGFLFINNRNLILILISLELLLLGLSFYFIIFGFYNVTVLGQINALVLLTLAGAESALGLALIMVLFRLTKSLDIHLITNLKN